MVVQSDMSVTTLLKKESSSKSRKRGRVIRVSCVSLAIWLQSDSEIIHHVGLRKEDRAIDEMWCRETRLTSVLPYR